MSNTTSSAKTIEITATGYYSISDYIPPRCRKPRYASFETSTVVEIPVLSESDVALAFTVNDIHEGDIEVIEYNDKLYVPAKENKRRENGGHNDLTVHSSDFSTQRDLGRIGATSEDDFASMAHETISKQIVVGEKVYRETGEPRYVVQTFGLGHNHGGTGLLETWYDNENVAADAYFRADEFEKARARAIEVAKGRGDTDDVPRLESMEPAITVHKSDAVRLVTVLETPREIEDARFDYSLARHRLDSAASPEAEAEAFAEIIRLRKEIVNAGFSPIKPEERPYEDR